MQNNITVKIQIGIHECEVDIKCPGEITQEEIKAMVESSIHKIFTDLIMKSLPTR